MNEQAFLNRVALQQDDWPNIQALAVTALSHHPFSYYVLLQFGEGMSGKAHQWLAALAGRLTPILPKEVARQHKHDPVRNVALTREGLLALGLTGTEMETFPFPFQDGMTSDHRRRILGDEGPAAPESWYWGGPKNKTAHVLLMLFARTQADLDSVVSSEKASWTQAGLTIAYELPRPHRDSTREHFGFLDGVGQPVPRGTPNSGKQKARTGHETQVNAGEFVLGYINEDHVPPASPSVAAERDPRRLLPPRRRLENGGYVEDAEVRDLGANGTYLVLRQIEQDVASFWKTLDAAAHGDAARREWLGAKIVGRWPSGAPTTLHPDAVTDPSPNADDPSNDFSYRPADAAGTGCPFGAHIRRSNPRDTLNEDPAVALMSARRHRLLRRGRSYGPPVTDRMQDDGQERGLHFVCLNADLERQFEFVQQTWINNPNFSSLSGEADPLIAGGSAMSIPACPVRERITGLQRFVTVRGGAYFLLPSLPALRFLASLGAAASVPEPEVAKAGGDSEPMAVAMPIPPRPGPPAAMIETRAPEAETPAPKPASRPKTQAPAPKPEAPAAKPSSKPKPAPPAAKPPSRPSPKPAPVPPPSPAKAKPAAPKPPARSNPEPAPPKKTPPPAKPSSPPSKKKPKR